MISEGRATVKGLETAKASADLKTKKWQIKMTSSLYAACN